MGLLKEILDKIDVHQDPVYLPNSELMMRQIYNDYKNQSNDKLTSSTTINIKITIDDDEDE